MATKKVSNRSRSTKPQKADKPPIRIVPKTEPSPDPTIAITVREFHRFIDQLQYSLDGISLLVKLAAGNASRCSSAFAAYEPMKASQDLLGHVEASFRDRFKELHGDSPTRLAVDKEIRISQKDIEEFEKAVAPACSFISLVNSHDLGDEDVVSGAGWAGSLVQWVAQEAIALMRARLDREVGGAQ